MQRRGLICAALVLPLPGMSLAAASGQALLRQFAREATSASGRFTQVMLDKQGAQREAQSTGDFAFSRPARFSWIVRAPYQQTVVSNGQTLWLYDPDLMQVTVKKLTDTVSATPAAVLFGSGDLDQAFVLEDEPRSGDLVWVKATPRQTDPSFASMRIGFSGSGALKRLEMLDHFSQKTILEFQDMQTNVQLPPEMFEFVPPKGADVLEDRQG